VTKADIIESVYEKVGFSKKEAAEIVEMVFDTIKETLERGEKIKISGFGNFIVRDKKSRVGRNPQTGEEIEISARRVLTFRPSQVLKNALNASAEAAEAAAHAAAAAAQQQADAPQGGGTPTPSSGGQ
jgi:integration host factor subunit alpha